MTYKQIEASREVRLWIGQIIVPTTTVVAGLLMAKPELATKVATKVGNGVNKIKSKVKRDRA